MSQQRIAKNELEDSTLRLAVLIDADNAQAAVIEGLLAEIARFGEATVKRIYGVLLPLQVLHGRKCYSDTLSSPFNSLLIQPGRTLLIVH